MFFSFVIISIDSTVRIITLECALMLFKRLVYDEHGHICYLSAHHRTSIENIYQHAIENLQKYYNVKLVYQYQRHLFEQVTLI
jgi:hypothetical protein